MAFEWGAGFLRRFRDGTSDALETVYWEHVDQVIRTARAVLRACAAGMGGGRPDIAVELSDVVQETFAKAFAPEARQQFDGQRPYGPYLVQITRNVAIDHWRARRRLVPVDVDQLIERMSLEAEARAHAEDWATAQTIAVVERYLASLEVEERRVHEAVYVKGLSQREAATDLGIGRQVVRTLEAKLRAGLRRELLQAGCLEADDVGLDLPPAARGGSRR